MDQWLGDEEERRDRAEEVRRINRAVGRPFLPTDEEIEEPLRRRLAQMPETIRLQVARSPRVPARLLRRTPAEANRANLVTQTTAYHRRVVDRMVVGEVTVREILAGRARVRASGWRSWLRRILRRWPRPAPCQTCGRVHFGTCPLTRM